MTGSLVNVCNDHTNCSCLLFSNTCNRICQTMKLFNGIGNISLEINEMTEASKMSRKKGRKVE